jgi:hypothetical protein
MRYMFKVALILLPVVVLALAGCGSSSSGSTSTDPFSSGGTSGGTIPSNGSVLNYNLTLLPSKTAALTNEELIVTATLKDSGNNPVANQTVNFSIAAGPATAVTTSMKTDSNGIALAFIKTGSTTVTTNVIVQGTATINSTSVTGYGNFQVSPGDANLISTRLSLSVSSFTASPNQELLVTATAKDGSGNPLANQTVTFSITAGPASMVINSSTTDSNGVATAIVKAGNPAAIANVIVQAATTVNANQVTAVIPFQIVPVTLSTVNYTMTMTPSKQIVDNTEEFYVTALLKDSGGNPVINQSVSFTVATGPATVNTASVNTDSTGKAIATVRAGNPASTSAIILQAATTVNGTLVTALAPVQIITNPLSPSLTKMTLTSDKTTAGINSDVLITASVTDLQAIPKPVQNQPVSFSIVAGPATIIDPSVTTDSIGNAVCRLKTGTVNSSSSIIVQASTTVNNVTINAYTTIQIVRQNSMIINFITSKSPTDPDGTLNSLIAPPVPWDSPLLRYGLVQLVPFQVLDENGIPMPNVNVNVSVYSAQGRSIVTVYPPSPLTTDDHGLGIFNIDVMLDVPVNPGTSNSDAIVSVATATVNGVNLRSYGGFVISISREKKPEPAIVAP